LIYVNAFRIYAINSGDWTVPRGQLLWWECSCVSGLSYYAGLTSPWYLTTLAVSEQLYDALIIWEQQGSINVTTVSQPFFANLSPGIAVGTYASSSATFTDLTAAVKVTPTASSPSVGILPVLGNPARWHDIMLTVKFTYNFPNP